MVSSRMSTKTGAAPRIATAVAVEKNKLGMPGRGAELCLAYPRGTFISPLPLGEVIGEIGTGARRSLEGELGAKVHLDLQVRVRRHWRRDEDLLDRLGIE